MRKIVVGFTDGDEARDALRLGGLLTTDEAQLIVAVASEYAVPRCAASESEEPTRAVATVGAPA